MNEHLSGHRVDPEPGMTLLTSPSSPLLRIESRLFWVLLQRRLRLPLPLSKRICGCGHSIDSFWSSPSSVLEDRDPWKKRICLGKCGSEELQRSRRSERPPTCSYVTWIWDCRGQTSRHLEDVVDELLHVEHSTQGQQRFKERSRRS